MRMIVSRVLKEDSQLHGPIAMEKGEKKKRKRKKKGKEGKKEEIKWSEEILGSEQ